MLASRSWFYDATGTNVPTAPAGWTVIEHNFVTTSGNKITSWLYFKVAEQAKRLLYTWTLSTQFAAGIIGALARRFGLADSICPREQRLPGRRRFSRGALVDAAITTANCRCTSMARTSSSAPTITEPGAINRVHPVQRQLRHRGEARGPAHHACARRQGAIRRRRATRARRRSASTTTRTARPADVAAAPARRRHVRGDRLGHRDPRGRGAAGARARHARRRRRSSITAAAGRGITSAARTRRDAARARLDLHVERARAGEDRRVLGRRPALRPAALPHDRRLRARRGRGVRRQEPVAVARLPARARHAEGDRRRIRRAR